MNPLVPAADAGPLPGPAGLFHALWVLTFAIHLLMVNAVLGGTVLSAVALARGRNRAEQGIAAWFASVNTWAISLAITFAIAPLLFLQLLYGRFFYSATILAAGGWLALLGLLTVAYYLGYLVKHRLRRGAMPFVLVWAQAFLFLVIAGIQVAVSLLHQRPDRWGEVFDHPWAVLGDPEFLPRYLHFLLAAVAMAGGAFAWWRLRRTEFDGQVRFGIYAAVGATALQVPVGFWMLFALPRHVLVGFMRGGAGAMMPLTLGILAGVAAIVVLTLCLLAPVKARLARHSMELLAGTMILMVITRHRLRSAYLAPESFGVSPKAAPQWGAIGVFAVCFILAAALTVLALTRAARDRAEPGEDAA